MGEQTTKIILQNIDNINEYYGINDDVNIEINKNILIELKNNKIQLENIDNTEENTEKILKALNKFLTKHKYIDKENKLYTLYDNYYDNYTDNVVCIIANFDNLLYIIQIKEEFYKNNDKILKKYNKDDVKTKLEELYNTPNNLQKLLS